MTDACNIKFESWDLPSDALTALPVMFRTYARKEGDDKPRETVRQVKQRVLNGLFDLGNFTEEEKIKVKQFLLNNELFSSGRFMWCGGTEFSKKPENFYSLYNCSNITVETWKDIAHNFNFLMQGNGAGAKLEYSNVSKLPAVKSLISLTLEGEYGDIPKGQTNTTVKVSDNQVLITVGDSRLGWCDANEALLDLASTEVEGNKWFVTIIVSNVRGKGELIKGFGGVTNPTGLKPLFNRVVEITNGAIGRKLKPLEVSFLLNESAKCTVAGNVRRSARIDQFSQDDEESGSAKMNLWIKDEEGNWKVDPKRDALRMANFTRVWHKKPTLDEIKQALMSQFQSGEGAIQFAPEAIARANADLLNTPNKKKEFIDLYCENPKLAQQKLLKLAFDAGVFLGKDELDHRMNRYGLNPCGSR